MERARIWKPDGTVVETHQEADRSASEPWYRLYYDTRVRQVALPALAPGDVLELAWRVDDVASENLLSDYFGEVTPFADQARRDRMDYVLLAPASRTIHASDPKLPGVSRSVKDLPGGVREHRWTATDLPRLEPEPGMPGSTESTPYVHVSTYAQLGRGRPLLRGPGPRAAPPRAGNPSRGRPPRRPRCEARSGERRTPGEGDPARDRARRLRRGRDQHPLRGARVRHPRLQALPGGAGAHPPLRRLQGQGEPDATRCSSRPGSTRAWCCSGCTGSGTFPRRPPRWPSSTTPSSTCPSSTSGSTAPPAAPARGSFRPRTAAPPCWW